MHKRNTLLGLFGILSIWLTAGVALPFVNVLKTFTVEQLMIFRGFIPAALVLVVLRGKIRTSDKYVKLIALVLPLATLGLFQGIRLYGTGPTMIVVAATPIVNVLIGRFSGRRLSLACLLGFIMVIMGVSLACWTNQFNWVGFAWAILGMVTNGILYELIPRSKSSKLVRFFWLSISMGLVGLALDRNNTNSSWDALRESKNVWLIIGFAFIGGFLYWMANLIAFDNLPVNEASVLAQIETPVVILTSYWILGERLSFIQLSGVFVALAGSVPLILWLNPKPQEKITG